MATQTEALEELVRDGFVFLDGDTAFPSQRWHDAVSRVAGRLLLRRNDLRDLRVPVAWALCEAYPTKDEHELAWLIDLMTPLTGVAPRSH